MAVPASTYSVAIECSFPGPAAWGLRARLGRAVEPSLGRYVAAHDDRSGQAAALVIAGRGAVPVVPRSVELEGGGAPRMVHQPDELGVAVARQDRAVGVLVVVDELELEHTPMWQDEDSRLEDELVLGDPDAGVQLAVRSLLSLPDRSPAQQSTQRRPVLLVQGRFDGSVAHGCSLRVGFRDLVWRGPNTCSRSGREA